MWCVNRGCIRVVCLIISSIPHWHKERLVCPLQPSCSWDLHWLQITATGLITECMRCKLLQLGQQEQSRSSWVIRGRREREVGAGACRVGKGGNGRWQGVLPSESRWGSGLHCLMLAHQPGWLWCHELSCLSLMMTMGTCNVCDKFPKQLNPRVPSTSVREALSSWHHEVSAGNLKVLVAASGSVFTLDKFYPGFFSSTSLLAKSLNWLELKVPTLSYL